MKRSTHSHFSNPWLTLVVVCFAQFMVVLDATVVNVALPSIQTDLDISDSSLQWVVNGYTLMFGGFLLLGGRMADLLGRRRLFVAGTAIFAVASLINGLATSDTMLIGARALQGFGGALVSPAALSIITTTFAEGEKRTKALAVWGAIAAGGAAAGLLLGGVLTEFLSWEWVFFVNVPIAIAIDRRRLPARARVPQRGPGSSLRRRRGDHGHLRAARARLRDRQVDRLGLGLDLDARADRRRRGAAGRLRLHRAAARRRRWCGSTSSACARWQRPTA